MNAALGTAGVALGLAAAVIGAVTLVIGLVTNRPALLRNSRLYVALLALGALLTFFAMETALSSPRLLAQVRGREREPQHAAPLHRSRPCGPPARGIDPAVVARPLRLSRVAGATISATGSPTHSSRWATLTVFVVAAFFFLLMVGPANPFRAGGAATYPHRRSGAEPPAPEPSAGRLPPAAALPGYVGFTIPFAFAVAALVTGRLGEGWLVETRRWTLFVWGFLTVGHRARRMVVVRGARVGWGTGRGTPS